jgi:predicted ATPase/class 3 adenylate cyclase/Tfp pilus assembly protein PilF
MKGSESSCPRTGSCVTYTRDVTRWIDIQALMPPSLAARVRCEAVNIAGERREVTVLFLDIANYTATAREFDSETVFLLTNEVMRVLAEVVFRYEGTIDKFTGDGLMALFGAPIAHENDPERAIRAALDMRAAMRPIQERVRRTHGVRLDIRIGINTGEAIAGRVGDDLHFEYTVIGNTVNLADRLQEAAQPGEILASFETYQRTRPLFSFRSTEPVQLKGYAQPVRVFAPLALRERPDRVRGLPGVQVPMVGRKDLLERLRSLASRVAAERRGRIVVITGEAGLGKSRLAAEFRATMGDSETRFYQGSCLNYARAKPLWLLASLVRDILGLSETDPPELQRRSLQAYPGQMGLDPRDIMPYLDNILGLERVEADEAAHLGDLDHTILQKLTHAALRRILWAEAQRAPVILILEDLHWVDPASREFVAHLIETLDDVPLMVLLISREMERTTVIRPLIEAVEKRSDRSTDIRLQPLSQAEGNELVDRLLERPLDRQMQALKERIVQRAEGNPFYAEEIVRVLIDREGLISRDSVWQITPQATDLLEQLPGTLNALVLARFDQLDLNLRQVLQMAAILGPSFSVRLLDGLAEFSEALPAWLQALEGQGFLVPVLLGSEPAYAFRHTLIQEAVYRTLLKRDRRTLHEHAARVIERGAVWSPDERTEALAYHYSESTDSSRAIPYLMEAAQRAARRSAHETAAHHYRRVLDLLDGTDSAAAIEHRTRAQVGLGQALKFLGQYESASKVLEGALQNLEPQGARSGPPETLPWLVLGLRELADVRVREGNPDEAVPHLQAGLDALGTEGAQQHPQLWRMLMDRLAWVRFRQGKLEEAFALASSATLGLDAEMQDDPIIFASLSNTLGGIFWQWGNLREASDYVQRSLELYARTGYAWGMAVAYTNLGVLCYSQGEWPEAAAHFQRAYQLRHDNGYLPEQTLNLSNLGLLQIAMGDHEAARANLEHGLEIASRLHDEYGVVLAQIGLGQLALVQGHYRGAFDHTEIALSLSSFAGAQQIAHAQWIQALALAQLGGLKKGLQCATEALAVARQAGLSEAEASCRRVLGQLRAQSGDTLEAETLLRESVNLCIQANAAYERGLALLELGRLYAEIGTADGGIPADWGERASSVIHESIGLFDSLGAVNDAARARALLAEVGDNADAHAASNAEPASSHPRQENVPLPDGAWHQAVVVWARLVAAEQGDEESVFEKFALVRAVVQTLASDMDGQVIWQPDGLTAAFGAPISYEDDVERAVEFCWRLVEHLSAEGGQLKSAFDFTLAVSRGSVVAGRVTGLGRTEFVVHGEPVEDARRIAESMPPGSIWAADAVRQGAERLFELAPEPGGTGEAQPLWRVVGWRQDPQPARGMQELRTRLIGREGALAAMQDLSRRLGEGIGGLVWVEGAPGIGKSRLIREFSATLREEGALVWEGICSPQKTNQAFAPIIDALGRALGLQPADSPDQVRDKLDRAVKSWPMDIQSIQPYLEMLLGVAPGGLAGVRLAQLEPEQLRQQTFVALRRLFKSMAQERPFVLILDDLHWIDPVSAELLLFLVAMVTADPILFVCAQRRQGADQPNDRLLRVQSFLPGQTVRLFLERLTRAESELLLHELLPNVTLPTRLEETILDRSEGNPYYLEEFVRMLIERGHLVREDHGWRVPHRLDDIDLPLPTSLETLIRSRADAVPSELRHLLVCAAAIGAPFDTELLGIIAGEENVAGGLRRLESRLLVARAGKPNLWQFHHTLIETVVYGGLLRAQRQKLHYQIAQALESRWSGSEAEHAAELAYHWDRAEKRDRALGYLLIAGERAAAKFANEEAIRFFEQTRSLLAKEQGAPDEFHSRLAAGMGDSYRAVGRYADSRDALESALAVASHRQPHPVMEAGLHRRLGETILKQGDLDGAFEHFATALTVSAHVDGRDAQIESARALTGLAWIHFFKGRLDQARGACEASMLYARNAGALGELAAAENLLGGVHYRQNQWEAASQHTTRAMVLREQVGYSWGVASTLNNLGILSVSAGQWRKARSFFERSLALREELGDVEGVALAHNNLGTLLRDQGELGLAEFHYRASLELATTFQMSFHLANSTLGLAQTLLLDGRIDAAQEALDESLKQAEAVGAQEILIEVHRVQAEILLAQSKWEEASAAAERSAEIAGEIGDTKLEASAYRVLAAIELARGCVPAGHQAIGQARERLREITDDFEAGQLAALAGQALLRGGETALAEAELRSAREIFMRLGANLHLRRVEHDLRLALPRD